MGQSIAIMNTKGGVGKSTLVMALAETLAVYHGKNVLVVDSDSQTSISIMMVDMARWEQIEAERRTLVEYVTNKVLGAGDADWKPHIVPNVSDVDDAETVYLMPAHMNLTLFEREVSAERKHTELRRTIRSFLEDAQRYFDVILIDCPPGLSVLTECWLRESNFYLPPTKADYLSVRGLSILHRFREHSSQHGFGDLLGVVVNQKDDSSVAEMNWHRALIADASNRCFETAVPRRAYIQRAADFHPDERSYLAKYPGDAGIAVRQLSAELLQRMGRISELRAAQSDASEADISAAIDAMFAADRVSDAAVPDDLPTQPPLPPAPQAVMAASAAVAASPAPTAIEEPLAQPTHADVEPTVTTASPTAHPVAMDVPVPPAPPNPPVVELTPPPAPPVQTPAAVETVVGEESAAEADDVLDAAALGAPLATPTAEPVTPDPLPLDTAGMVTNSSTPVAEPPAPDAGGASDTAEAHGSEEDAALDLPAPVSVGANSDKPSSLPNDAATEPQIGEETPSPSPVGLNGHGHELPAPQMASGDDVALSLGQPLNAEPPQS